MMGMLRDRSDDKDIAVVDQEITAAVTRLQQIPEHDGQQRRLVRIHIDDLLDHRLQLREDHVIRAHERQVST